MPKLIILHALGSRVLAVAVVDDQVGDWSAYVDAVPGMNHEREKEEVARKGDKLSFDLARILFPHHAKNFKWRD